MLQMSFYSNGIKPEKRYSTIFSMLYRVIINAEAPININPN